MSGKHLCPSWLATSKVWNALQAEQIRDAVDGLADSVNPVEADLGNQPKGSGELGEGIARNGELADADRANSKLRDCQHSAGELPDRDDSPCRNRSAVWTILEGDVNPRESCQGGFGFVLKAPSIPRLTSRIRRAALRAGYGLLGNFVFTFSTRFHLKWLPQQNRGRGGGGARAGF